MIFYYYYNTEPGESENLLIPALKGIVVEYWSQDGASTPNRLYEDHQNVFMYDEESGSGDLQLALIKVFSHTVVDATGSSRFMCILSTQISNLA